MKRPRIEVEKELADLVMRKPDLEITEITRWLSKMQSVASELRRHDRRNKRPARFKEKAA